MGSAVIRAAIKSARRVLQGAQQPMIEIVELEEGAIVPEPTEGYLQWIIEYKNDEEI